MNRYHALACVLLGVLLVTVVCLSLAAFLIVGVAIVVSELAAWWTTPYEEIEDDVSVD